MRFFYYPFLPITLFPIPYFANIVERQVVEQTANGEVYIPTDVATLSSYTVASRSSVQPPHGRNSTFATSRKTAGISTPQTLQSSLRGSGALEPTNPAIFEVHNYLTETLSSSWNTHDKASVSSQNCNSSHTSQGSQTTIIQTSSAELNVAILANTTSTLTSILATPSTTNEAFTTTSRQAWSQGSAHAQLVPSTWSHSNDSTKLSTSFYPAAVLNNGSFTAERKSSSEHSSIASTFHALPAVNSVSGLTGSITTTWGKWTSSQTPARTASTGNENPLATTSSAKASTTSTTDLSSRFSSTKTSVESWPASISFCSISDGVAVVEVGFATTLADGKSSITNTRPSQSLITMGAGLGCAGEIAVFSDDLTTTIQLSTLPSATSFPQNEAQVFTQSGAVVQYSPETLSGYDNSQPIKVSTNFVEVINGHTTTQGGWWLIGAYGHIDFPKNRLWKTGKGIGCIGGPLLCNMPCGVVDVGLGLFVLVDHKDCTPDETGPPGYPGGPVFSIDLDPDPPYPQEVDGDNNGEKTGDPEEQTATNEEESTETTRGSTITSRPRSIASSSTVSSASQVSSSSASAIEYMIVAAVGADQTNIQQVLREFDPERGGSYEPDVGATSISGGTWINYELAAYEAEQLSSRSDILAVVTCAAVSIFGPGSSPSAPPQTVDATVLLETLIPPSSATLSASVIPERRRDNVGFKNSSGLLLNPMRTKTIFGNGLQKRDPGTRLVRQRRTLVCYLFPPIVALFIIILGPETFSSL